jgi:hypothetical protein
MENEASSLALVRDLDPELVLEPFAVPAQVDHDSLLSRCPK